MARKLALFVSYFFQPLLMPTLVFAFLIYGTPELVTMSLYNKGFILLMVFLTTFIIPILSMVMMRLTKNISSFHMTDKEERVFPFSMISLFYMLTTYLFYLKFKIDPILVLALAVITISVILLTSITFFLRISAHMTGIAGLLAIIAAVLIKNPSNEHLEFLFLSILVAGGVASSRLYLNSHNPLEVYLGFFLGFGVCFGAFYFWA